MMPMAVLMALHDQKGHVTPHFSYLDVRNAMVPLMVSLLSIGSDVNGMM